MEKLYWIFWDFKVWALGELGLLKGDDWLGREGEVSRGEEIWNDVGKTLHAYEMEDFTKDMSHYKGDGTLIRKPDLPPKDRIRDPKNSRFEIKMSDWQPLGRKDETR